MFLLRWVPFERAYNATDILLLYFLYSGKKKPWGRAGATVAAHIFNKSEADDPTQHWFQVLGKVGNELNLLSLNVTNLGLKMPSLGRYPSFQDMVNYRGKVKAS
jgi:hypothetical protein